jgi:signal transduction histidine kinase
MNGRDYIGGVAPAPMPFWQRFILADRSPAHRYAAAAALAVGFLLVVAAIERLTGAQFLPIATLAVVLSAIYGGMGPALLAAVITAVGVDYLFIEPLGDLFGSWPAVVRVATYVAIGMLIAGIVGLLRDAYRELHAQYRQTEAARRARETMIAIVSHDLRSPLTAVLLGIGYVKRAAGEGRRLDSLTGALDAIHRSADSMKRLVDDLLDAARIESGRFSLEPARQRLVPILEDAVEAARLAADARRVRIDLETPAGAHVVRCDRLRLAQVLGNLIGNAVKFSPEGARVELKLHDAGDWLRIDVRDWGPGIGEEHLPHVFTRYWQASDTAHLGTGLGLYIARAIVESHGGRIEAASRAGEGSTFSVYLRKANDRP